MLPPGGLLHIPVPLRLLLVGLLHEARLIGVGRAVIRVAHREDCVELLVLDLLLLRAENLLKVARLRGGRLRREAPGLVLSELLLVHLLLDLRCKGEGGGNRKKGRFEVSAFGQR